MAIAGSDQGLDSTLAPSDQYESSKATLLDLDAF